MKRWLITAASALMLASAAVPAHGQPAVDVATLVNDNNAFAFDLYAKLRQSEGNLFLSPYSISNAMAMTYPGARGATANEIEKAMHFSLGQKGSPFNMVIFAPGEA